MELLRKLKINTDIPLMVVNSPADCISLFDGVDTITKFSFTKTAPQLIVFATDSSELDHFIHKLEGCIAHETVFWVCYPKKSGRIVSDLIRNEGWKVVFDLGYRGVSSVSVNDDWTGMRFTNAPKKKETICDLPMEERKSEGIDFINRTVTLPADAKSEVNKYNGMQACFDKLSFTTKKEYVMGITESKKEETRIRRIQKMVTELQQRMLARK